MSLRQKLPNYLTISRIMIIPLLVVGFYLPEKTGAMVTTALFLYASVTDWFDGYLARQWNAGSVMGRVLDPIADKLLVAAALIPLAVTGRANGIAVLIILLREILVSGLREHLMAAQITIPVTTLAKYKTAVQMLAITLLLITPLLPWLSMPAHLLLWVATLLTVITGADYLRQACAHLKD